MKKKLFVIIALLCIPLLLLSYYLYAANFGKSYDVLYGSVTIEDAKGKTDQQIAEKLMESWLDSFKSLSVKLNYQLRGYSIAKIDNVLRDGNKLQFTTTFSVERGYLPLSGEDWIAGNGQEDGSWVRNKIGFAQAELKENKYILYTVSSGP